MTMTATAASTITWKIDPAHSSAEFKVKHMMISNVKGAIKGINGVLAEHATDASLSSIEATLDVTTLHTGEADRDAQQAFVDAGGGPGFRGNAAMRGGGGMGDGGLGVAEIGGN